ncbi:MAG TPA: hypothetical protein PK812_07285 [Beijerinckiaceae bacterium]|nr:hypothetical protein [Beijerinckiaceae bacterium]
MKHVLAAATLLALASAPVAAQQAGQGITVQDVKVQLFLERTGTLSENLVGSKKALFNTPIGAGDAGEPAEAVLVTLVFQGPKNSRASDKLARDLAAIKVTQTAKTGPKILMNRAFAGLLFGESGIVHKAVMLENATCAPLEIEARVGRSRKAVKIDFQCGE